MATAIETKIAETIKALIRRQLGTDTTLIVRDDESVLTETFDRIVVSVKSSGPICIDPSNFSAGLQGYNVEIDYYSFAPHETGAETTRWQAVDAAIWTNDPEGIDLSAYTDFYFIPGSGSEASIGHEGDRNHKRTYKLAVQSS